MMKLCRHIKKSLRENHLKLQPKVQIHIPGVFPCFLVYSNKPTKVNIYSTCYNQTRLSNNILATPNAEALWSKSLIIAEDTVK